MVDRPFWQGRVLEAWREAPVAWLAGVRRAGKTTLARSISGPDALYLNCDLPAVVERSRDPELLFRDARGRVVVFDEVHQLEDPARVLKVGADVFPGTRILATGSSTLAASQKFRDTLAGRKRMVHLVPVLWDELGAFGASLEDRLLRGGLPPALMASPPPPSFYREWMDSFFARDVQRLFGFRDFARFNDCLEYLLRQSGGQWELSRAAATLGVARATVENHVRAMEVTHAVTLVRPFHGGGQAEIVKQPKAYGFDTGFVCFAKGWDTLRAEDKGLLWEHCVLETLLARFPQAHIRYWRDKAGREVDFVIPAGRDRVDVVECKWNAARFDPEAVRVFRGHYPQGRNYLVTPSADPAHARRWGDVEMEVCNPSALGAVNRAGKD